SIASGRSPSSSRPGCGGCRWYPGCSPEGQVTEQAVPHKKAPDKKGPDQAGPSQPPPSQADPGEAAPDQAVLGGRDRLGGPGVRTGLVGANTTGDTSGYGGLRIRRAPALSSPRPYGSYFDEVADRLAGSLEQASTSFGDAIERVIVANGEMTFYVRRERLPDVARRLRDDPALAFELCTGVSGVHYPVDIGRELHAVYHLVSLTHNRRLRLEVAAP